MKNPFIGLAAAAAIMMAAMRDNAIYDFTKKHGGWSGGNRSSRPRFRDDHEIARKHGIPKWLRQYHARYSKGGAQDIVQTHLKYPGRKLDHWSDRTNGKRPKPWERP